MTYDELMVDVPERSRLYFFSDGHYEVTRPDGSMMAYEEFVEILGQVPRGENALTHAIDAVRRIGQRDVFEDDLSIVEVSL